MRLPSCTLLFSALISIAAVVSPAPALAQNEALRGKTTMSAYVSLLGETGYGVNGAELRLSLEQQLHEMGINVLPHGDPPNYPVLNLTVNTRVWDERRAVITNFPSGRSETSEAVVKMITYTSKIELRQLAPGRTTAMKPIEDVAIWTKTASEKSTRLVDAWRIPGDALNLAIEFVNEWRRVNGSNHPATADRPMPLPNPNAPSVASSEPELPLYAGGNCEVRAGGGCVTQVHRGVIDSVEGVPNSQRQMVLQQIEALNKRGQKIINCEYGPANPQSGRGFVTYHFWYQSAPLDILKLLVSAFPHPFMEQGRVAVTACPAKRSVADAIYVGRFN
jgi:hypothetical protein